MHFNDRDEIIAITPQWKGERFDDGRPKVDDKYLKALKNLTLEEVWKPIFVKGYESQFEGRLNESILTGESEPVVKHTGDILLSGSSVISGKCSAEVICENEDSFTSKIANEVKSTKQSGSEMLMSMKKNTKFTGFFIIPLGILMLLFFQKYAACGNCDFHLRRTSGNAPERSGFADKHRLCCGCNQSFKKAGFGTRASFSGKSRAL